MSKVTVPLLTLTPPPCQTKKVRVSWSVAGKLFHEGRRWDDADGSLRRESTHILPAERSDSDVERDERERELNGRSSDTDGCLGPARKRDREGECYRCRVGVDVAVVEGDGGAAVAADIDAPTLPNKEGARVLVSCWKALP